MQSLKISRSPNNGIRIAGACSCPVGRGCKHLAAVLIAAQRKEVLVPRHQESLFPQASKAAAPTALPAQIQTWLADFDRDDEELTEEYPASLRTRVFYVLNAAPSGAGVPQLRIDPMTVTLRKDNSPGTIKRYAPHQIQTPAKYLRPSDLIILTRLSRRTGYSGSPSRRRSAGYAAPHSGHRPRPLGIGRGSGADRGAGAARPDHLDHQAGRLAAGDVWRWMKV